MFKTISLKFNSYFYLLVLIVQFGFSQTHIYEHFGVDEGLPSSEVYDIYQDKQGYVWFATDKGLSRYNGYEFENFTTKDGLPDNTIIDFYPQENGQVWCYGYQSQSLFYFDDEFSGFKLYKYNNALKEQLTSVSVIKSVVIGTDGTLYAGGYSLKGYIKINSKGETKRHFDLDSYRHTEEVNKGVNLGVLKGVNTFFYVNHDYKTEEGVIFFNTKKGTSSRLDFVFLNKDHTVFIDKKLGIIYQNQDFQYYETKQFPIGIKRINDESFFVGYYSNGAEIRNVSGAIIQRFLPNKSVSNFLVDAERGFWFTTLDDGVFYIKNPNIKVFTEQHISSLVKDNHNNLYLGFENGNIGRLKSKTIETLYNGLSTNAALVEFNNEKNVLYGYGDGHLKDYTYGQESFEIYAKKLPEEPGNLVLSSIVYGFYKLKNENVHKYKLKYKVQDVCLFNMNLLIGTSSGLLIEKNDTIKPYQQSNTLKSRIDDIDINQITNIVYMATQGEGVVVYNDSIINTITKESGLTSDIVSEVHIENDSTIWACTNTGLNRIDFKPNNTFDVTNITKADGLLSNDIDDVEIINDTVWVATKKGLCFFKKDFFDDIKSSRIISLSLKRVTVNNKILSRSKNNLKYNENSIKFMLQGISHRNTDKIDYLYRLKEVDTNWTTTTSRNISFPSLSPGNYTFEATARVFNNPSKLLTSYTFKILPPFWKSWWFYCICVLLLSGLVYLFFRIRVLSYNQDVFRELIRLVIKRLKRKEQFYTFKSNGEDFKIPTRDILYINSQGNYLDIVTKKKTYTIRYKIGEFIASTPDELEYLRVHRSYIIRIDQVSSKGKNWVVIKDQKIPVGETYLSELNKVQF